MKNDFISYALNLSMYDSNTFYTGLVELFEVEYHRNLRVCSCGRTKSSNYSNFELTIFVV